MLSILQFPHGFIPSDKFVSYQKYVNAQTANNKYKLQLKPGLHWITEQEMKILLAYIKKNIPQAKFGICHGVRNGWEVGKLRKLGIEVIGTEISDTASQFKNVIQWDFHNVKPEWLNKTDFIYSNALDHSYNPEHCIRQWLKCLTPNGLCFIEWTSSHDRAVSWNVEEIIKKVGTVKEIIEFPHPRRKISVKLFVVGK